MNTGASTNTAVSALRLFILNFLNALLAHLNGDWGQHSQVNLTSQVFSSIGTNTFIPSSQACRILASTTGTPVVDFPLFIPLVPTAIVESISYPAITTQPVGATITGKYTLNVTATGQAPLSYQWFLNNTPIINANLSAYTVLPVVANSGVYTVLVSNQVGNVFSNPATVTVKPSGGSTTSATSGQGGGFSISDIFFPF